MTAPEENTLEGRVAELEITLDILMDAMDIMVDIMRKQDASIAHIATKFTRQ